MSELDYDHAYHAGNHADVWKHVALLAFVGALKEHPALVLDLHGGEGEYALGGDEWRAGIGRLLKRWKQGESSGSTAVDRYLGRVRKAGDGRYPGSPRLILGALPKTGRLRSFELQEPVATRLRARLAGDDRAQVQAGDGYALMLPFPPRFEAVVVHIDPPYVAREEWTQAADAVIAAAQAGAKVMLWYPIKSFTRPNALFARLREAGVSFVAHDLLVRPIEEGSRALAGSGVLWVGAPDSARGELCAAAAILGPVLSGREDWGLRVSGHFGQPK